MHARLGRRGPQQGEPTPALPLTISPDQIGRFGILGHFSLHWLPKTFLSVFLEGNFLHGWQWRTSNCTYPDLIV